VVDFWVKLFGCWVGVLGLLVEMSVVWLNFSNEWRKNGMVLRKWCGILGPVSEFTLPVRGGGRIALCLL
jgi:hypothetical protein